MTKHPKLNAPPTSTPPGANEHDATESALISPQGTRRQGGVATGPITSCDKSEVAGQHLDEIAARRRTLLERLAET